MERINKDKVLRLWSLIIHTYGKSKYKKDLPTVYFFYGTNSKSVFGEYYNQDNHIKIWFGPHDSLKDIAATMLHEYAHHLQFWPWYTRYDKKYTYYKNPYELQAKEMEKLAPDLMEMICDKEWENIIRKKRDLPAIYNRARQMISI